MTEELIRGLALVLVALVTVTGVIYANRTQKGTRENRMVDQLQEDVDGLRKRMVDFEARDRVYLPHIMRLNLHIEQEIGPPAPPLPQVIQNYLTSESN